MDEPLPPRTAPVLPADPRPLDPARHGVESGSVGAPTAVLSIDVEPDYNGTAHRALDRLPDLLAVVRGLDLPLTAFVEGRLFGTRPDLVRALADAGADVQLHCYDHRRPGDTPDDLARGVAAYRAFFGRGPAGYRAHTFRLGERLYGALLEHGFRWDSSILPGRGLGANPAPGWRRGDWFRLDGRLLEFPVASLRPLGLPYIQSYRLLLPRPLERTLPRLVSLPRLLVYDMHMVDLVRTPASLAESPLPRPLKALYALSWRGGRRDSFDLLADGVAALRARGYGFTTCDALATALEARP